MALIGLCWRGAESPVMEGMMPLSGGDMRGGDVLYACTEGLRTLTCRGNHPLGTTDTRSGHLKTLILDITYGRAGNSVEGARLITVISTGK